ncbi:sigma-70 family RNA polymerase sigma factor [Fulvivirgaceae bacterium BMA12]|uniref:Sigma-70 family RNA polymerase sigma factor n=1 Tax=Agaribacillus aureus TaxID=3051825 RepID=A0ABT8LEB5_9BACT|nr:sigma-70 family RNA polymerase sigma factor [Fulvivirgaceae bacterium BMA12]
MKEKFQEQIFQHQALIHKICRMYRDTKEEREDLFQEIIFQLWKAYPQFQGRSKISTWMYRIGLNTAIATFRKKQIEHSALQDQLEISDMTRDTEDDRRDRLFWAIKQMNDADRAIITLYLDNLNYREISEIMGVSENYIGVRLNRIKQKIRKRLNIK